MKLGTKGRYAVMAMVDLAKHSSHMPVIVSEIAERQGLSVAYLEQLFIPLRRCLYVRSSRGKKGGFILNKPAKSIKVSEILKAVGEDLKVTRCNRPQTLGCLPSQEECVTHALWAGLEAHMLQYLASISLEDLCAERGCDKWDSLGRQES